jgi:hypothetical protein
MLFFYPSKKKILSLKKPITRLDYGILEGILCFPIAHLVLFPMTHTYNWFLGVRPHLALVKVDGIHISVLVFSKFCLEFWRY